VVITFHGRLEGRLVRRVLAGEGNPRLRKQALAPVASLHGEQQGPAPSNPECPPQILSRRATALGPLPDHHLARGQAGKVPGVLPPEYLDLGCIFDEGFLQ
jgi:hypothetical protein